MMRYARAGAAGLAAAAALAAATSPAEAKTTLQRQVNEVLRHAAPGARQVGPNRVTWARDGVTLTLVAPGVARAAGMLDCPVRYACLWQDANGRGRRVQFFRYGEYRLAAYGMPPGTHRGASSFWNRQTGGAGAFMAGSDFTYPLLEDGNIPYGNIKRKYNDRASTITLWHR
jgi:hypothetical protein